MFFSWRDIVVGLRNLGGSASSVNVTKVSIHARRARPTPREAGPRPSLTNPRSRHITGTARIAFRRSYEPSCSHRACLSAFSCTALRRRLDYIHLDMLTTLREQPLRSVDHLLVVSRDGTALHGTLPPAQTHLTAITLVRLEVCDAEHYIINVTSSGRVADGRSVACIVYYDPGAVAAVGWVAAREGERSPHMWSHSARHEGALWASGGRPALLSAVEMGAGSLVGSGPVPTRPMLSSGASGFALRGRTEHATCKRYNLSHPGW